MNSKNNKDILNNLYEIPLKYKKAEIPYLQDDRNKMYDDINYKIDKKTGQILQQLFEYESDKYVIGIHRTNINYSLIFEKGILYSNYPDIHDHVQIFSNFTFMLREILYCEGYKFSKGCFIVKIPKTAIHGNVEVAEPIYYKNKDGNIYLRPEFIAAFVPVNNRKLGEIKFNSIKHDDIYKGNIEFYQDDNVLSKKSYGFVNIIFISVILIIIILFLILK